MVDLQIKTNGRYITKIKMPTIFFKINDYFNILLFLY